MGILWLQGVHMIHCAYNSLWMGQILRPDWDMFQSDHACARFHAGSRAICGGPVYISDRVGSHDFDLIKKLVYPDGTVPKCIHFPLPTRDCLFKNPLFDQETLLKIWNFNKVLISLMHLFFFQPKPLLIGARKNLVIISYLSIISCQYMCM